LEKDFRFQDRERDDGAPEVKMSDARENGAHMKILVAEDDAVSRRALEATLRKWGYEVVVAADGTAAWQAFQTEHVPDLVILDWMMPGLDGLEVCRKIRARSQALPTYIILLTMRGSREDVVCGLEAGADDYVTKPFDHKELHARLRVGQRLLELQRSLADRVRELEDALARVKHLQGLLPICSYCKKIRNDRNYWQQVEGYISEHSEAQFSHGICPECYARIVKPELGKFEA
jgi:CheY-like chemotaxis protein